MGSVSTGAVVPATDTNLRRAAELLRGGALVSFPTETVYGVGADASNPEAVKRIFAAKGRPAHHPLIVHLPHVDRLSEWARDVPPLAITLAERFWPGPLTLVLAKHPNVAPEVTGGQNTVALRVPGHPLALRLLREFSGAIAAPSANRFGRVSPTRAEHAAQELGDAVALVLDGGPCEVGVESTIVDLSGDVPRLLRPGGVPRELLAQVLGGELLSAESGGAAPRAPGTLASHYAPVSPVELVSREELEAIVSATDHGATVQGAAGHHAALHDAALDGAVAPGSPRGSSAPAEDTVSERVAEPVSVLSQRPAPPGFTWRWLRMPAEPEGYARELYAALRELDGLERRILVEAPPQGPAWETVNDRLARAAAAGRPQPLPGGRRDRERR